MSLCFSNELWLKRVESRLAKAAGTEASGDEKLHAVVARSTFTREKAKNTDVEKVHALVARSTFRSQMYETHQVRTAFGSWDVEKVHTVVARRKFRSQKSIEKTAGFGPLLDVQVPFCVASAWDSGCCHRWAKREGFVAVSTATTTTLHYITTTLHYITLHSTPLHYT